MPGTRKIALAKQTRKINKSSRPSKKLDTQVYQLRIKSLDAHWFSRLCRIEGLYGWEAFKRLRDAYERFAGRLDLNETKPDKSES